MPDTEAPATQLAAFVLPVADGRVLLARHTYAYSHLWAMVGGVVEPGEPLDVAARREVLEETGLEVVVDRLIALAHVDSLMIAVYDGQAVGGEERHQAVEIAELRWFTQAELEREEHVFGLVRALCPALFAPRGGGLRRTQVDWIDRVPVEVRVA